LKIEFFCIALLCALCLLLGAAVTVFRGKLNVLSGCSDSPEDILNKLVRAHGNSSEYVPILVVLFYILSQYEYANWVHWFIVLATFCRVLFVAGILFPKTMARPNPMRFIGAVGTYVFGLGLCFAILQTLKIA